MDSGTTDTGELIRKLSRRQWAVTLALVVFALGALLTGRWVIASNAQAAEMINLAGRQRMLSQRMTMYLALQQSETGQERRRQYRDLAASASAEFERAHMRLSEKARQLGPESPFHSLYFGPAGSVDAGSRAYLSLVRTGIDDAALSGPAAARVIERIAAEAGSGLIDQLHQATELYQHDAEANMGLMLNLLKISTLLISGLVAFSMFGIFRPMIGRLASDVAKRDDAQRALKASEERFKGFSDSSSDWYWETDAQHRFAWFQGDATVSMPLAMEQVMGKTRQEILGDLEKTDVEKWRTFQADLDAHRPFRDFEYRVGTEDKALRWISASGQPVFGTDGNFIGYRGTARYIQERKDMEASHLRLQMAIEQSPVSIMMIDAGGRIIFVNAHFSKVSGYSSNEVIGQRPKILLWSGVTSESVFADMRKALMQGDTWQGEVCGRKKSGELFWEHLSVSPVLDHQGKIIHHVAVGEDVTAQKQIQRREQNRNRILETIASGTPLPEPLNQMVAMAEAELSGGICSILRLDPVQGRLFSASSSALSDAHRHVLEGIEVGPKLGSCGAAAFTATRIVVEDIASHPYCEACRESAGAAGLRACWSQPIMSASAQVLGTLTVHHSSPRPPSENEVRILEMVSSLAAICMERDNAQQALREQEKQARRLLAEHETVLANALVGIVYLKQRRIVSCNRRIEEIFGYGPGELIGESSERFYASHEAFVAIGEDAYRTLAEHPNYSAELMLKRKDGSLFHGALNGCAVDPAHPQEGSIWVYADISERYRAEQEVRKLLQAIEQSPVSIVITNPEGIIEYVNPRFARVTGYSSEEVVGQNARILQSGETSAETYEQLWQTLLAGKAWRGVLLNKRKNGDLFWEEASISPIVDENRQITHFLAIKEDITERKRIDDELEDHRTNLESLVERRTADLSTALDAAKVADQAKDAFLAHVSHELRTPLTAVIGLTEMARRISTDPRQQDYLDKVTGAGRSLAAIINDLLDLSKISAGRMEFENAGFTVRDLVQRSRSVVEHRADEKGLKLTALIDAGVPDVLVGDALRIEQILLNLLSNAIKFTPTGSVELRIGLERQEEHRVCLGIDVEDTGIGLSAESIGRLFQPFAQADASMSRRFGGTGLGLVLCRRLAEMMGGDIGVTSREGSGTTFHVRLWLGLDGTGTLAGVDRDAREEALPVRYRNAQVLVVDDQAINREIVEALLAESGISPRIATNGQEALDILQKTGPHVFDLVLMDVQMPVMDGLTATRAIRSWHGFEALPIIAMTAHTMEHEKEVSAAAGMSAHIGKPFETAHFFRLLAYWIPVAKHQMKDMDDTQLESRPRLSKVGAGETATGTESRELNPGSFVSLPGIDTQAGLARFVGNEKRYRHWLTEFLTDAPGYAAQVRASIIAGNAEEARQSAHAIKGRVGMLGMTGLHPIVAELEAALKQGAPADELLDRMQAAVKVLCAGIRAGLGVPEPAGISTPVTEVQAAGPMPESVARLIIMLESADGGCAEAIELCLAELEATGWEPRLKQALQQVRNFDYDTACKLLARDPQDSAS